MYIVHVFIFLFLSSVHRDPGGGSADGAQVQGGAGEAQARPGRALQDDRLRDRAVRVRFKYIH